MSKRYRCLVSDGGFTKGKIYELTSTGCVIDDYGGTYYPAGNPTAIAYLERHTHCKFEEVTDMFTLDDLKTGMIVKLRDDSIGVVMRGMSVTDNEGEVIEKDSIVGLNFAWALLLKDYYTDLRHKESDNDIMRVARAHVYPNLTYADEEFTIPGNILYDRSKIEERKRMTVEEIEKQLGYKVAIVDAEGK